MVYGGDMRALTRRLTSILVGCDKDAYVYGWSHLEGQCKKFGGGGEVWDERVGCCAEGEEAGMFWACDERDEAQILGKTQLIEVTGNSVLGTNIAAPSTDVGASNEVFTSIFMTFQQ